MSQSYAKSPAAERKFTTREMVLVGKEKKIPLLLRLLRSSSASLKGPESLRVPSSLV